jgi:hypothetical protein
LTPAGSGGVLADVTPADPFPFETARDLLGICRALYLAFKKMGPAWDAQREQVQRIGEKLTRAMAKAERGHPGTWDQTSGWALAEEAAEDLGKLIDQYLPAKQLIAATSERMKRKR